MHRSGRIADAYCRLPAAVRLGLVTGVIGIALFTAPLAALGHPGGRYGTAGDMETALGRNPTVLFSLCKGFGTPRKAGLPKQFWAYKHFRCYVIINAPYTQLCLTIHTLRNGRLHISRRVRIQDAQSGDCG